MFYWFDIYSEGSLIQVYSEYSRTVCPYVYNVTYMYSK